MANSTIYNIAKNIAFYRKKSNLTQEQLSEMCDISCDYLSEIERGKKIPRIQRLVSIAEVLGIEPYQLLMNLSLKHEPKE